MCPPLELRPAPDRKVTIENLHDPKRDCYFLRVSFESEGRYWSHDYYDGDDKPEVFQAAANAAFEAAVTETYQPEFRGEF